MILEEATKEAFGYYASELTHGSNKPIIAVCELCGELKITTKHSYYTFCNSCSNILSDKFKGEKNPNYNGGKVKCTCLECGKKFEVDLSIIKAGYGKYCSRSCAAKGRHPSEKTRALMSTAKKGDKHPMFGRTGDKHPRFGKHHTEETKVLIRAALIGKHHTEETKALQSISAIKRMHNSPPAMTAPEKVFDAICKKYDLPFVCNVNAKQHIGNAIPDFIHINKKIIIEVFGNYFHSIWEGFKNLRYIQTVKGRTEQLKAEGYKCIVIWESDLMREDAEKFIIYKLHKEGVI